MAKTGGSFQSLGGGVYRVSGVRVNPKTGRYILREASGSSKRKTTSLR